MNNEEIDYWLRYFSNHNNGFMSEDGKKITIFKVFQELKELINKAYEMGNDSKISLYLRIMDILDYYDETISIERKMQIKKEYGIGDDKQCQN